MKNKILLVIFFFFVSFFSFCSIKISSVYAYQIADAANLGKDGYSDINKFEQVNVPLSDKLVLKNGTPVKDVFNSTDDMINLIVKAIFVAAGVVLLFVIIVAGFSLIQGESKDKDKAKTAMTSATIGFIVMFAAYWIMQIIQIITGLNMGF